MVYTDKTYLTTRLTIFDMLYQSARAYTLKRYGPKGAVESDKEALRKAVINAVEKIRDGVSPPRWS